MVMGIAPHTKRGQLVVRNCNSLGQRPGGFNPYHYFCVPAVAFESPATTFESYAPTFEFPVFLGLLASFELPAILESLLAFENQLITALNEVSAPFVDHFTQKSLAR
jgi:hypothetical protein